MLRSPIPALPDVRRVRPGPVAADALRGVPRLRALDAVRGPRATACPPTSRSTARSRSTATTFSPLDLTSYLQGEAAERAGLAHRARRRSTRRLAAAAARRLPYTVNFANDPAATQHVAEVRIVTQLDDDLDICSFRLGDIKIGKINVHLPATAALFQGDFDFTQTLGFILRVSAGVDQYAPRGDLAAAGDRPADRRTDPGPDQGPAAAEQRPGRGRRLRQLHACCPTTGGRHRATQITASARVLFNNAPPEDTPTCSQPLDAVAPATTRWTSTAVAAGSDNYLVHWTSRRRRGRLGLQARHAVRGHRRRRLPDLAAAADRGLRRSWSSRARPGHTYEFLALATDWPATASRRGVGVDGRGRRLARQPGQPADRAGDDAAELRHRPAAQPRAVDQSAVHRGRTADPGAPPPTRPSEFDQVLRPFAARAFATRHRAEPRRHRPAGDRRDARRRRSWSAAARRAAGSTASAATAATA